jgi:hypothetical protein
MTDDLDTLDRDESGDEAEETREGAAEPEEPQPWAKTSSGDAEDV